jgi:hypothetical protein
MKAKFWSSLGLAICLTVCLMVGWPNYQAQGVTAMGLQEDFIRVVERVRPSVVSLKAVRVVTYQTPGVPEDFFRGTPFEGVFRDFGPSPAIRRRQVGQGSGIIIDAYGHILTNSHVVAGAQQIKVRTFRHRPDPRAGPESQAGSVGGLDPYPGGPVGNRHRQPLRPGADRDRRGGERHRPPGRGQGHLRRLHPDGRLHQPREQRRAPVRPGRPGHGHQLHDRVHRPGHRLRHPHQPGQTHHHPLAQASVRTPEKAP